MADAASYEAADPSVSEAARHHSTKMSVKRHGMRNRLMLLSSALVVVIGATLLYEARAGVPVEHCGFWTTIEAGLSCR
ncbi:hypothetical protein C2U70_21145 [Bradyrhizobium guangdongense]|uniref:hypothetical protein n=1 Tax=Bradyrhizobium guangdongense TaxID=1325090 RepID=UPI00112ADDEA|nr:hypothetical protein [Bradyrhizobium guangdongense]TPQ32667.1 hypothetical protein C2U70_21145 [Bradyrhizobium guangdongense]